MDREAGRAFVYGVTRVGHDLVTKQQQQYFYLQLSIYSFYFYCIVIVDILC